MIWNVDLADELEAEWDELPGDVQDELLAHGKLLEQFGPQLGRPRVDTLKGSRYGNMKELRFDAAHGVWCVVCGVWCVVCGLRLRSSSPGGVAHRWRQIRYPATPILSTTD